jgi:hypothetical protein
MRRADWLEGVGREPKVHRVALLVLEIDDESRENSVDRRDFPETPAAMHAKAGFGKLHQRLDMLPADLPRGDQLLKLFFHICRFHSSGYH